MGHRVQRVHARLLAVRDPVGLARRRHRSPPRADAHRAVVVGVHDADRRGRGVSIAHRHAVPVRRRRGRRVPEHVARALPVVSRSASAGRPTACMFFGSRVGGMLSVPDRAAAHRPLGMAAELRDRSARSVWCGRRRGSPGTAIARPSTRRSRRASSRGLNRTGVARAGRAGGRTLEHAVASAAARAGICTRSARCTSPTGTACTSTSRGCRPISFACWGSRLLNGGLLAAPAVSLRRHRQSRRADGSRIVLARDRGLRAARCGLGFGSFLAGGLLTFASTLVPQPDRESRAAGVRARRRSISRSAPAGPCASTSAAVTPAS